MYNSIMVKFKSIVNSSVFFSFEFVWIQVRVQNGYNKNFVLNICYDKSIQWCHQHIFIEIYQILPVLLKSQFYNEKPILYQVYTLIFQTRIIHYKLNQTTEFTGKLFPIHQKTTTLLLRSVQVSNDNTHKLIGQLKTE